MIITADFTLSPRPLLVSGLDRSRYQYYLTEILNEITEEIMTELLKGDRI